MSGERAVSGVNFVIAAFIVYHSFTQTLCHLHASELMQCYELIRNAI